MILTDLRGWPATGAEAAAVAVLCLVTLVIVGEEPAKCPRYRTTVHRGNYSLCSVDMSALLLALGPRHDVLVPVQQPVTPVAVLVDAEISLVKSEGRIDMISYMISPQPP